MTAGHKEFMLSGMTKYEAGKGPLCFMAAMDFFYKPFHNV